MHLRLKTKITLIMAALMLAVVAVNSALYTRTLTRLALQQANGRAQQVILHVYSQARKALADSEQAGNRPASGSSEDLRAFVQKVWNESIDLQEAINEDAGNSPLTYEVSITDSNSVVIVSSDVSLPGRSAPARTDLQLLIKTNFLRQIVELFVPPRPPRQPVAYEVTLPIELQGTNERFGVIRVAVQTSLLRKEMGPALRSAGVLALASVLISVLLAGIVSSVALAPLKGISAQLDQISKGKFDQQPLMRGDEFGQVSTKISEIGMRLRGVQEIFSTLRENLDQVLGGLDDGLLLFSQDGRAVMVSPAVERFLDRPSDQLLGQRAEDIFPPDHPLREAIRFSDGVFVPVAATEVILSGPDGVPRRVGISVDLIQEGTTQMGALVKFSDLESRERITTQLQVSERMSALARITAGVAHEVKNPLNSMRLWLENLKESLPKDDAMPQQAVRVLDSEIDRLDNVVKRFLDFTRPPEMRQEESSLKDLLEEVLAVERPQLDKGHIKVMTRFSDIPPVFVDKELLKQAIMNLLVNAVQAMPEGGHLSVSLDQLGEYAHIQIADTGPGIPPELKHRVFELFFTTRPGGSGIGLASAFRTVQLHNGSIDFDSEVGRGTTFRIKLPLARKLEAAPARARESSTALAGKS
jgi:signal transduction histidine kinase